jgi:DNA-binding YbaB/EbfC family protein
MNMQNIMAQAQRMQREINQKKEELEKMNFTGKSELVEITFNGAREVQKVKILHEGDLSSEDKEILEDMVQIAIKDAFSQINKAMNEKLGQYAGALDGLM